MSYKNLTAAVADLERTGQLVRITAEVDPRLEVGAVQRRVYARGGPALLFTRVKGSAFPMLGNLFGTMERARFLFRDTLPRIERLVALKGDPAAALRQILPTIGLAPRLLHLLPKKVAGGP